METIIPILIAIVVFAFQAYANFQKEQEKARKRNLGQPPLPEDNADRPITDPQSPPPDYPSQTTDRRPPDTDSRTPIPGALPLPPDRSPATRHRPFEDYAGVMSADEVKRVRKARQHRQTIQRLEVEEGGTSASPIEEVEFDLRDAVIKSAILERPYQ